MGKYLESMKIGHAKQLADELHVPLLLLLEASFSLSHNVRDIDVECVRDDTQRGDLDVTRAI